MINAMLIASDNFWNASGASHQPAFIGSCLTISHICLPCLPSRKVANLQSGKSGRIVRWQVQRGGRVVRRQVGKGGRVAKWQGGRFLVLFNVRGRRMSPRFHIFVSNVDQWNAGAGWVQDYLAWLQRWVPTCSSPVYLVVDEFGSCVL